jgi:hypothetical protein
MNVVIRMDSDVETNVTVVSVIVDTQSWIAEGNMRPDGYDIQFTVDSSYPLCGGGDVVVLEHYLSGGLNTPSTEYFVRIPQLKDGSVRKMISWFCN